MHLVINLEDGGGQEFFVKVGGALVSLSKDTDEEPQEFKSFKLIDKKIQQIRGKYPPTCRIYALTRQDFDDRRSILRPPHSPGRPSSQE